MKIQFSDARPRGSDRLDENEELAGSSENKEMVMAATTVKPEGDWGIEDMARKLQAKVVRCKWWSSGKPVCCDQHMYLLARSSSDET